MAQQRPIEEAYPSITKKWSIKVTNKRVCHQPKCSAKGDENVWAYPWLINDLLENEQGVCHQLKDTPLRVSKVCEFVIN